MASEAGRLRDGGVAGPPLGRLAGKELEGSRSPRAATPKPTLPWQRPQAAVVDHDRPMPAPPSPPLLPLAPTASL